MNTAEPRLLVVEDDPDVARLICRSLGEFGFACDVGRERPRRARRRAHPHAD